MNKKFKDVKIGEKFKYLPPGTYVNSNIQTSEQGFDYIKKSETSAGIEYSYPKKMISMYEFQPDIMVNTIENDTLPNLKQKNLRKPTKDEEKYILSVIKSNGMIGLKHLLDAPMYKGIDFRKTFKDAVKRGEISINKNGVILYNDVTTQVGEIPDGSYDKEKIDNPHSQNEVNEKDVKQRLPQTRQHFDDNWQPILKKMTLDNLKALREKSRRSMVYCVRNNVDGNRVSDYEKEKQEYELYDSEIKSRLKYINQPMEESDDDKVNVGIPDFTNGLADLSREIPRRPNFDKPNQGRNFLSMFDLDSSGKCKTAKSPESFKRWQSEKRKKIRSNGMDENKFMNKALIRKLIKTILLEHVNDSELFHLFKTIDPKSSLYDDTPFGDNLRNFSYIIMTKYGKTPEDCKHVINKYWRQSPDQAERMVAEVVKYIQEKKAKTKA